MRPKDHMSQSELGKPDWPSSQSDFFHIMQFESTPACLAAAGCTSLQEPIHIGNGSQDGGFTVSVVGGKWAGGNRSKEGRRAKAV